MSSWTEADKARLAQINTELSDDGDPIDLSTLNLTEQDDGDETWLRGRSWPYADADGDPIDTMAEMTASYPQVDLRGLLTSRAGRMMPAKLRAEVEAEGTDPDHLV